MTFCMNSMIYYEFCDLNFVGEKLFQHVGRFLGDNRTDPGLERLEFDVAIDDDTQTGDVVIVVSRDSFLAAALLGGALLLLRAACLFLRSTGLLLRTAGLFFGSTLVLRSACLLFSTARALLAT